MGADQGGLQDLESEMGMSREKLIRIAMLLGSDYTEGIRLVLGLYPMI